MSPGEAVAVTFEDGTVVEGQVWALADVHGYRWVALDDGRYVAVNITTKKACDVPLSRGGKQVGRLAA